MTGSDNSRAYRHIGLSFTLLATLTVIISLTPYAVDGFLPAFPEASEALGANASQMQVTLSTFLLGIAIGQLLFGPVSDRFGRRGPLVVGSAVCTLAAVTCAIAPTIEVLVLGRFIQGFAGAAGMVISRAIVRDRTVGPQTVAILAMTSVAAGVLNLFAPVVGGYLLATFGWRGPLWFVAVVSAATLLVVIAVIPETLSIDQRDETRWFGLLGVVRHMRNRRFLAFVVIQAGSYGTLMAYVAASPFVYRNVLGFDGVTYGLLFAMNAAVGVTGNFVANRYLLWIGSRKLIAAGLTVSMLGVSITAVALWLGAPPGLVAAGITISMATIGLNGPNVVGLALGTVTRSTGSAAAALGFAQFCVGSLVAPLMGSRASIPPARCSS